MKNKTTPTKSDIQEQIKWLKENKRHILPNSAFGDDHHAAIDAQIEVLEQDAELDVIDERQDGEEWAENVADAARQARYWMDGDEAISPSKNWESLIRK